jgi:hypothetical protein
MKKELNRQDTETAKKFELDLGSAVPPALIQHRLWTKARTDAFRYV